jgi:osmotically-inducible protein OsmY
MRVLLLLTGHTKVIYARIDVKTNKGHVRLSGTVDNFYKKWSAIDNALKVSEVAEVIDQIKVKPTDTVDDRVLQKNIK